MSYHHPDTIFVREGAALGVAFDHSRMLAFAALPMLAVIAVHEVSP